MLLVGAAVLASHQASAAGGGVPPVPATAPNVRLLPDNVGQGRSVGFFKVLQSSNGVVHQIPAGAPWHLDPGEYRVTAAIVSGYGEVGLDNPFTVGSFTGQILPVAVTLPDLSERASPPLSAGGDAPVPSPVGSSGDAVGSSAAADIGQVAHDPAGGRLTLRLAAEKVAAALEAGRGRRSLAVDLTRVQGAVSARERRVEIPADVLVALARSGSGLAVADRGVSLNLPWEELSKWAAGGGSGDVALSIETVSASETDVLRPAGTALKISLHRLQGERAAPLDDGATRPLSLSFPYSPASFDATSIQKLGVYRLSDKGEWDYVGGERDAANSRLTISVSRLGTFRVFLANVSFADMSRHWARADVEVMAARRVLLGDGGGRFHPDRRVTRAEFAAMLTRSLNLGAGASRFSDVPVGAWYRDAVGAAAAAGIVRGEGSRFRPGDPISRQEMAVMVSRAIAAAGGRRAASYGAGAVPFKDRGSIAPWAAPDVAAAVGEGLMRGREDGAFAPGDGATRAEAAAVMRRLLMKLGRL